MYLGLDQFVCTAKQFRSDNYDRGRTIAYLFVLFLSKVNKYATCRMFYRQERKDGGAVVGDRNFLLGFEEISCRFSD